MLMTSEDADNIEIDSVKKVIIFIEPLNKVTTIDNRLSMDYIYRGKHDSESFQNDVYYLFGGWM